MYKFLKISNIYNYYFKSVYFFIRCSSIDNLKNLLNIVYRFSIDTILIVFLKIKYASNVKEYKNFCKNFDFSNEWFDNNIPIWIDLFKKENLFNRNLRILEIGCFEGRSTLFLLKNLNVNEIICVDPMLEYEELKADFKKVNEKFKNNVKIYKNCILEKKTSKEYFKNNLISKNFDLVYLDGDHHANQVYDDLVNIYKNLNNYVVIIIDDLFVDVFENKEENLINGVYKFLDNYGPKLKIIYTYHQIIIKKNDQ